MLHSYLWMSDPHSTSAPFLPSPRRPGLSHAGLPTGRARSRLPARDRSAGSWAQNLSLPALTRPFEDEGSLPRPLALPAAGQASRARCCLPGVTRDSGAPGELAPPSPCWAGRGRPHRAAEGLGSHAALRSPAPPSLWPAGSFCRRGGE